MTVTLSYKHLPVPTSPALVLNTVIRCRFAPMGTSPVDADSVTLV